MPVLLVFAFWFLTSPFARGALLALAAWTKFAALVVVPLWAGYPEARWRPEKRLFAGGFAVATVFAFSILLLEPDPAHAARVFWDRTFGWQVGRDSPFSIWGWGQYHAAGIPDLGVLQQVAIGAARRRLDRLLLRPAPQDAAPARRAHRGAPDRLRAHQTHWFYLYIPWFFPFVAFVVLAPRRRRRSPLPPSDNADRELVATG